MGRCSKVLIMAGGTGGHVFPALAVATELRSRGVDVSWLGTQRGIEAELVPANNLPIRFIKIEGVRGAGIKRLIKAPFLLLIALIQAVKIIAKTKPDVVVGLGGFASGPGGVAARLLRKPLVIHEQNATAGTTNKLLSKIASRVMVAFPGALPKGEYCGNPVRVEIVGLPIPEDKEPLANRKPKLLVLGGSLGALAINQVLPKALMKFPEDNRPEVRHQCGKKHVGTTLKAYREADVEADVQPFITDMAEAYGWADYVVCRSGALTVSELASAGLGSLLIPYPYAIDDHQTSNAQWLADKGAAVIVQQSSLNEQQLFEHLEEIFVNPKKLLGQSIAARKLAKNDAAKVVADVCEEVCYAE